MSTPKPRNAIILARISDDRAGDEKGVSDQVADGRKLARRLGWRVGPDTTHIVIENDTSAFRRHKVRLPDGRVELRTVRPGFRRVLDLLGGGAADGLVALDLDRAARDPRDLEDLIDTVEARVPRVPVESVTGSLKLANDADVAMARVMVAIANKSSRDTSRRVARAQLRLAEEGRRNGGARPYGHNLDGTVHPEEAEVIREATEAILSGVGLRRVAKELNARGVTPLRAKRWATSTLRSLLQQPRLAGLASWNGQVIEGVTPWCEPILQRGQWEAVRAVLRDPGRRVSPGPIPKHLLSHLALCGHESHPDDDRPTVVHGWSGSNGRRVASYRCMTRTNHLSCTSTVLDDYVTRQVIDKLSQPDAAELLAPRMEVDTAGLAKKANSLRTRLSELGDLVESGDMPAAEYRQRKTRLSDQLARVEGEMTAAAGTSPLVGIAGRKDASEVWAGLDLGRKKAVIDVLMTVVVLPARRRGREFDPDRVRIDWRKR